MRCRVLDRCSADIFSVRQVCRSHREAGSSSVRSWYAGPIVEDPGIGVPRHVGYSVTGNEMARNVPPLTVLTLRQNRSRSTVKTHRRSVSREEMYLFRRSNRQRGPRCRLGELRARCAIGGTTLASLHPSATLRAHNFLNVGCQSRVDKDRRYADASPPFESLLRWLASEALFFVCLVSFVVCISVATILG